MSADRLALLALTTASVSRACAMRSWRSRAAAGVSAPPHTSSERPADPARRCMASRCVASIPSADSTAATALSRARIADSGSSRGAEAAAAQSAHARAAAAAHVGAADAQRCPPRHSTGTIMARWSCRRTAAAPTALLSTSDSVRSVARRSAAMLRGGTDATASTRRMKASSPSKGIP